MADEKLDDAVVVFEKALKIDPNHIETLLKLGYAKFHLEDHMDALKIYDRVLDIDVTNAEAWNLKSLVYYDRKNYAKALDAVEKAVESEPTFGMAMYNKACYLSMLNEVPESMEALKRSIVIDVKNARRAVKDYDFVNLRIEEGFKRIIDLVVLESIRQGYHTIGAIVWTTFISSEDCKISLLKLQEKGLVIQHEQRKGIQKIPTYDLVPEMIEKFGNQKKSLLGFTKKPIPVAIKSLKNLGLAIQKVKSSIEEENIEKTIDNFDMFIDTKKCGQEMIGRFLEEHREIRLWKIRLKDRGIDYLIEHKQKMIDLFENIEFTVTKNLKDKVSLELDYSAERSQ